MPNGQYIINLMFGSLSYVFKANMEVNCNKNACDIKTS